MILYGAFLTFIVTVIFTEGFIFEGFRGAIKKRYPYLGYLLTCFLCFGTWVGVAFGFFVHGPFNPVFDGLIFQAIAYLIFVLVQLVGTINTRLQQ